MKEKLEKSKAKALASTVRLTPENLSHLNENHRKINNGFEVLPVGTLAQPAPVKDFGVRPENTIKIVSDKEPRPTRKLQKRDRSISGSRRSSSDGGLSEKDNFFYSCDSQS